jgi:nucleoside-diphosphate-sugar epimerase
MLCQPTHFFPGALRVIVLLIGATGFLGSHLSQAMLAAGHEVIHVRRRTRAGRMAPGLRCIPGDFAVDHQPADWVARLQGVDVVVNAAGILRESRSQRFEAIHVRGPCALFDACVQAGVRRVVQVSALGADASARSAYHHSKRTADEHLLRLPVSAAVVRPSLLYGPGGTSARLFSLLAALPLLPVPGKGQQMIQPLHVEDAVRAILALLPEKACQGRVDLVGPAPLSLKDFLLTLRQSLGLGPALVFPVPEMVVGVAARVASWSPHAVLDRDTWCMLQRGNTGDATTIRALLGHAPRAPSNFVSPAEAPSQRVAAQLDWLLPMLRLSLATVWVVTAVVSLAVFPRSQSLLLVHQAGVPPAWAPLFLWSAGLLDLLLGVATLCLHRWRALWVLQALLIVFYTVVITWQLPEFWAHPYGPVLKNLPMLGVLWLLYALAPNRTAPREGGR